MVLTTVGWGRRVISRISDAINLTFAGPGRKELPTLGGVSQFNLLQISSPGHTEENGPDEQIRFSVQYIGWDGHKHT